MAFVSVASFHCVHYIETYRYGMEKTSKITLSVPWITLRATSSKPENSILTKILVFESLLHNFAL